ncbi:MAG: TIM barrel protein [Planctomycetes bacterium]|nr:TIM barrel protein [Planctomycetota bacterium]
MRRDEARLVHILVACDEVTAFLKGVTREEFLADRKLQCAIFFETEIIGEAARAMSRQLRKAHPEVPWDRLIKLRHSIAHEYFRLDPKALWEVAQREIPAVRTLIKPLAHPDSTATQAPAQERPMPPTPETVVAAQLYGWTQPENFPNRPPLIERLDEAFAAIKRAGIDNVEWDTAMAADRRFVDALRKHGLGLPAAYSGGTFHVEAEAPKSIAAMAANAKVAKELGVRVINCNPAVKPGGAEKTDEELAVQARWLDACGAELKALGIRFALHNHSPEMRSGAREVHSWMSGTTPGNVWFNADVEWIHHGGGDPVAMLERYGERTASLHVRDALGTTWVQALGEGELDFPAIAAVLKRKGFAGPISIEHATMAGTKITRSFEENHRISRDFIRKIFGD